MKKFLFFTLFLAVGLFAKSQVSTSILPTKFFIEQIAGDTINVNVLVNQGADPHTYEPKPKQMIELEKSEIYFAVGIEFEDTWLERFSKSYPNLKIVKTDANINKISMPSHNHEHHEHSHDDHHHHDHDEDGLDPHIWLDPVLVKTQATNIANALISHFPEHKAQYEANLEKFLTSLDELDLFIKNELKNLKNREFIVYHPSWGYFAKRYDLTQIAIEIEGKEPKPTQLAELIDEAKEHKIGVIFVAPQFSQKSAKLIAAQTNAKVISIDQLPYKWDDEMRKTAKIFADSLKN